MGTELGSSKDETTDRQNGISSNRFCSRSITPVKIQCMISLLRKRIQLDRFSLIVNIVVKVGIQRKYHKYSQDKLYHI